ncbi:zinc-binding alcohol dehydrogenase [Dactylosporangium sp. AC04546]|uniref:L-erythro-3,5-diaminohexanoate dehydrogenase n=1 Tax=Dactylosporangium sp. AC04546 TaxID=2862460 RepID=UPI001EDCD46B|nr:zinc-binding alcohol dehydrogenase [Dactylosporangium sp. AC04546]WVK89376.1 zinc-binding alcohol dehydrogenase [Dactylosporangium sp. AC04546]
MGSPIGLHRVVEPAGVLPQAAHRLDPSAAIGADEVRVRVERLNLDAASFRQLVGEHAGDGDKIRAAVLGIVEERGKMHNPVTGSGGMLIGTVEEAGPASPLGLRPGDRVATLVSLTLTPLRITDDLARWDGRSEQVPCDGHAILFARSIAAVLPDDLDPELSLAVLDVCGCPALVARTLRGMLAPPDRVGPAVAVPGSSQDVPVKEASQLRGRRPVRVAVLGAAGKSGSLALAAARDVTTERNAVRTVGVVRDDAERERLEAAGLADHVVVADARDAVGLAAALDAVGGAADLTVVCVDVPGCEHAAILATADGGTVVFFSMATSFPAAALGAEGLAADVTMIIGNGYVPGHAEYALRLLRSDTGVRALFEARLADWAP